MGCNICVNKDSLIEEEFKSPENNLNSAQENIIIENNLFNKKEENSSPKIKNQKINITNIIVDSPNQDTNLPKTNTNTNNNNENPSTNNIISNINKKQDKENRENSVNEDSKILSGNLKDYSYRVIYLINHIRENPSGYSYEILKNLQYISREVKPVANQETGNIEERHEIFFLKKVKVKLERGERAFIEAADYLRGLQPMKKLEINNDMLIKLPDTIEEMNDKMFSQKQLIQLKKKINISAFFKDTVRNPEVAVLLMIVGDYNNSQNKKRNSILNPKNKYIAVDSKFIGDLFIAYYTFAK